MGSYWGRGGLISGGNFWSVKSMPYILYAHDRKKKDRFRTDFKALFCRKPTERKNLMYGKQKEYRRPQVNESF